MNGWVWFLTAGLAVVIMVLLLKIYLLKKSAREIRTAFIEKTEKDTNTLIHISGHDADMRELAAAMNSQLRVFQQSRQKFEHGDLELKEAITNISHDLRTPLTAIYGYLRLLKTEDCPETRQNYLCHRRPDKGVKAAYRRIIPLHNSSQRYGRASAGKSHGKRCAGELYSVLLRGIDPA